MCDITRSYLRASINSGAQRMTTLFQAYTLSCATKRAERRSSIVLKIFFMYLFIRKSFVNSCDRFIILKQTKLPLAYLATM
jgi:hypothetical protein